MIKRIVKLTFQPDLAENFLQDVFESSKSAIRAFPGCHHMELLRDISNPHIMFTFSIWESEAALDAYRHSPLFVQTWAKTKVLFGGKPEAWSVQEEGG